MKQGLLRYRVNGQAVRHHLSECRRTPEEVAAEAKFDVSTIHSMASGGTVYFNTVHAVAKALRVKPTDLTAVLLEDRDDEPREYVGLRALVDSAVTPMYFTDAELVIQHCNRGLESIVNAHRESIVGFHIRTLLAHFVKRVVPEHRVGFLTRQHALLDAAHESGVPELYDVVQVFAGGSSEGGPRRLVEIRGELIRSAGAGPHVASLVYYNVHLLQHDDVVPGTAPSGQLTELKKWFTTWLVRARPESTTESAHSLTMPPADALTGEQRMKLALDILTQFEQALTTSRQQAREAFGKVLSLVTDIAREGGSEAMNAAVIAKLHSIPEQFGATLTHGGVPVKLRRVNGTFEARSKGAARKSVATGKSMMSLAVQLNNDPSEAK